MRPGVRNKKFYISSDVSAYWQTLFNDSFYLWYLTDTPINFDRTYNFYESTIDCYTRAFVDTNTYGEASFWTIQPGDDYRHNGYNDSWDYGEVLINNVVLQNTTYETDSKIIMHEIGHVFGLYHVKNPYDLMYEKEEGHMTYRPSANDISRVNKLHK